MLLCFVYLSTHKEKKKSTFESTALKTYLCSCFTSVFRSVTWKDDIFCPSITMLFPHLYPQHPRELLLGHPTQFPLETTASSTETHWAAAAALPVVHRAASSSTHCLQCALPTWMCGSGQQMLCLTPAFGSRETSSIPAPALRALALG